MNKKSIEETEFKEHEVGDPGSEKVKSQEESQSVGRGYTASEVAWKIKSLIDTSYYTVQGLYSPNDHCLLDPVDAVIGNLTIASELLKLLSDRLGDVELGKIAFGDPWGLFEGR